MKTALPERMYLSIATRQPDLPFVGHIPLMKADERLDKSMRATFQMD
ncbi:MAG: hypothetical protein AAFV19_24725 [Pseudomonadota bacterium]